MNNILANIGSHFGLDSDEFQAVSSLMAAAEIGRVRLDSLACTFSGNNFTDRYEDGPRTRKAADAILAALDKMRDYAPEDRA